MADELVQQEPLRANVFTRFIYAVALSGLVFGSLSAGSGWIGLALGGGFSVAGRSVFLLIAAAVVYRIYAVLRYRTALDARRPFLVAWPVRWLGWLLMAAGAAGTASLFLIKPLTLLFFKSAGENGIGYFVVGLYATLLSGCGVWGCLLFELSRVMGRKLEVAPAAPRPTRKQDFAVMGVLGLLAAAAVAQPALMQFSKGEVAGTRLGGRCVAPVLLDCAAKIAGNASRAVALSREKSVQLRSNIEAIEYRHPGLRPGVTILESVEGIFSEAGYRVAPDGEVLVEIEAVSKGAAPTITLRVADKTGETARFTTAFAKGAKLESTKSGGSRIVVELDRDVFLPLLPRPDASGNVRVADGLYTQLRSAVISEREATMLAAQSPRNAVAGTSTPLPANYKYSDDALAKDCAGIVELRRLAAPERGFPPMAGPMHEIAFTAGGDTALLEFGEKVSCHGNAVWFVRHDHKAQTLFVRQYGTQGQLLHAWRIALPRVAPEVSRFPEPATLQEAEGKVQLRMYVIEGMGGKQQLLPLSFPS